MTSRGLCQLKRTDFFNCDYDLSYNQQIHEIIFSTRLTTKQINPLIFGISADCQWVNCSSQKPHIHVLKCHTHKTFLHITLHGNTENRQKNRPFVCIQIHIPHISLHFNIYYETFDITTFALNLTLIVYSCSVASAAAPSTHMNDVVYSCDKLCPNTVPRPRLRPVL